MNLGNTLLGFVWPVSYYARRISGWFAPSDSFLRRFDRKRYCVNGIVDEGAFKHRKTDNELSFTFQAPMLTNICGLEKYQLKNELKSGDLPGVCRLTFTDLAKREPPFFPPKWNPVSQDFIYGHLHCTTDLIEEQHRERLAAYATTNGVLFNFVPKKKRK